MKQHILKYSLILLSGLLIQWWIFDYSSFLIPEYILFTRIRIEGLALVSYIITILIFFQKDLLEKQPDKGMFKLTWEGTSMCFWAEMVFQIVRGRSFLQDVNGDPYPDLFPRSIYCGTYNYFGIESFLSFLRERRTWVEVL